MRTPRLTYANVVSSLALFIALGGTSWALARNSVGTPQLKASAVTSIKVKDGSLALRDLASGAKGRRGPRGPEGPQGNAGPAGAAGIATAAEPWHALPLAAGWFAYGQGHRDPSFRKDQLGMVHVRGLVTRPAGASPGDETIAVLPAGYRPSQHDLHSATDGGKAHVRVDVYPDGQVFVIGGGGPTISLSDITFATD